MNPDDFYETMRRRDLQWQEEERRKDRAWREEQRRQDRAAHRWQFVVWWFIMVVTGLLGFFANDILRYLSK